MRILFIHNNFPGQYRRIIGHIAGMPEVEAIGATLASNAQSFPMQRVNYTPHRKATPGIHHTLRPTEDAVLMAQAAFQALAPLKKQGWAPDIVMAHSGWGPSLLVKELWPKARLLCLLEWYCHARGSDADFLGEPSHNEAARTHFRNVPILLDIATMDWGTTPTVWQFKQFPEHLTKRLSILHEGVDTAYFSPGEDKLTVGERTFTAMDEVITYVARGMEPYRGFPQFMEMVSILQKRRPDLHVLIAGKDRTAYGAVREDGATHREHALKTLDLDLSRIHFLGLVPYDTLRAMFRITRAHVYLTVPFVLSWSMLEAMAAGALVVGSRTPPVEEAIIDGESGLLADFFDTGELADQVEAVLRGELDRTRLTAAARRAVVDRYDLKAVLPRQWALIRAVAEGREPRLEPAPFF